MSLNEKQMRQKNSGSLACCGPHITGKLEPADIVSITPACFEDPTSITRNELRRAGGSGNDALYWISMRCACLSSTPPRAMSMEPRLRRKRKCGRGRKRKGSLVLRNCVKVNTVYSTVPVRTFANRNT